MAERPDSDEENEPAAPQQLQLDLGDDSTASGRSEAPNPFSFKHFLNCESGSNYANKGARPKGKAARTGPELSSALPDFVQDHLVVEQCYLGADDYGNERFQGSFPLDLPLAAENRQVTEVGNSKSLPDFLADGAARNRRREDAVSTPASPESDADASLRRQLAEKTRLCERLGRELEAARGKERGYAANLARHVGQVEANLEASNRRAAAAENALSKARQEAKSLAAQVASLRLENESLRVGGGEGAAGGEHFYPQAARAQRLAGDLRRAAQTAEHSLRQLLGGVDNLRQMADSIEERRSDDSAAAGRFANFEEDAGPAL